MIHGFSSVGTTAPTERSARPRLIPLFPLHLFIVSAFVFLLNRFALRLFLAPDGLAPRRVRARVVIYGFSYVGTTAPTERPARPRLIPLFPLHIFIVSAFVFLLNRFALRLFPFLRLHFALSFLVVPRACNVSCGFYSFKYMFKCSLFSDFAVF